MTRASQDKAYRTFIAGFITEATGLTSPENSCQDIDNCDIELKGSVRRRLGLNQEVGGESIGDGDLVAQTGSVLSGFFSRLPGSETCAANELAVTAHVWPSPGGDTNLNFVIIQVGNELYIRNWDASAVSDFDSIDAIIPGATQITLDGPTNGVVYNTSHIEAAKQPLQSTTGFGRIWFTSPAAIPFYVEYDRLTGGINVRAVGYDPSDSSTFNGRLAIRDFNGVGDGLTVDNRPSTLSEEHRYNLLNQGWYDDLIYQYHENGSDNVYPSNSQQWVLGRSATTNKFSAEELNKSDFGNATAPKGRGVMHALTGSRDNILGGYIGPDARVSDLTYPAIPAQVNFSGAQDERADSAFTTCAFYAGRLWMAGDANQKRANGVYFSKIIQKVEDAGILMQVNDPTSDEFSDLLATDGGVIYITEATKIQKLVPYGTGLMVCASNGIWFIYGADRGFTADSYSVDKVSTTGILGPASVVSTDTQVVFFGENSINIAVLPERGTVPIVQDIAQTKIFSYYSSIDRQARAKAHGTFDVVSKKVFWSWLELDTYAYPALQCAYNRMLILDTRTGAFTKYSFASSTDPLYYNGPAFPKRGVTASTDLINSVKVVTIDGPDTSVRIGEFYDRTFYDYTSFGFGQHDYASYLVTGYELLDDLQRNKQATYLHSFFNRTETGVHDSGGDLVFTNPSGCSVVARWDWHNTGTGGRWSTPQTAYRYRRPFVPADADDLVDTGEQIVYTKLKIRGKGRSLALRYDSTSAKDFQLLGFSVAFTASGV